MTSKAKPLHDVEAYLFDVFGTVVDWYGSVTEALQKSAPDPLVNEGASISHYLGLHRLTFISCRLGNFCSRMARGIQSIHVGSCIQRI